MAIAFQSASSAGSKTGATSYTISFTTAGNDRLLLVNIDNITSSGNTTPIVTYAGVSMMLVCDQPLGTSGSSATFALLNPASGTNNIIISGATSASNYYVAAACYSGVDQYTTLPNYNSSSASSATASITHVTYSSNSWMVGAAANTSRVMTAYGASVNLRIASSPNTFVDYGPQATPGSVTVGAAVDTSSPIGIVVMELKPVTYASGNIAYDASASSNATAASLTYSHTCSGVNRILFVTVMSKQSAVSSVTYAGQAMTQIGSVIYDQFTEYNTYLFYIVNPSTGANNVVITVASSTLIYAESASYTGVAQSAPIDANVNTSGNSNLISVTPNTDKCWAVFCGTFLPRSIGCGILRVLQSGYATFIGDTGRMHSLVSPININVQQNNSPSAFLNIIATFKPAIISNTNRAFFKLMSR